MADTTPPVSPEPAAEPTAAAPNPAVAAGSPHAQQPYGTAPATNVLAIVSLVLSVIGISIAGAITGHIAIRQIRERGEGGYGIALAGTIVGWVGCALWIVSWLFVIVWVLVLGGTLWGLSEMPYDYSY